MLNAVLNSLLLALTVSSNVLRIVCVPFGFADWFGIKEGSLQIEDGEILCLPTGYKCDFNEECCDGMCVHSKLSKHKLCLVVGWKDELKLREIYSHDPLRPEDVEYLRRTYNISLEVTTTTKSPKRQIHVVYDEDIYDIPPLPDETKLFPITDGPLVFDIITTEQSTTIKTTRHSPLNKRRKLESNLKKIATSTDQNYLLRNTEPVTKLLPSPQSTNVSIVNIENKQTYHILLLKNNKDLGSVNNETEDLSEREIEFINENITGKFTTQDDFVNFDHDYDLKSKSVNLTTVSSDTLGVPTERYYENSTTEGMATTNNITSALNVTNLSSTRTVVPSTIEDLSNFLDEKTMLKIEKTTNAPTDSPKFSADLTTLQNVNENLSAYNISTNLTPSKISVERDTVTFVNVPKTQAITSYNTSKDSRDNQTTTRVRSSTVNFTRDNYNPHNKIVDLHSTLIPEIFLSGKHPTPLTHNPENISEPLPVINRNTSIKANKTDIGSSFENMTVSNAEQTNEKVTVDYSEKYHNTLSSKIPSLSEPNLDNSVGTSAEVNRSDNYTNFSDTAENITYLNLQPTDNYNSEYANTLSTINPSFLFFELTYSTPNYTETTGYITSRAKGVDYYLASNINVNSTKYENDEPTGNYSKQYGNTSMADTYSTDQTPAVHAGKKPKRWLWKKMKKGVGKMLHRKKGKHHDEVTTEDYDEDIERRKSLTFNIFKPNKKTTKKKSKTKKLWNGFKKIFRKKDEKSELVTASEPSLLELDASFDEKSQSDFIRGKSKHLVEDIGKRYENSFVLPLNKTKRQSILSKVKGWFKPRRNGPKANVLVTEKSRQSTNFIKRARRGFQNIISKRTKMNQISKTDNNIHFQDEATTVVPSATYVEIITQSTVSTKKLRNFKLWGRIKSLFAANNKNNKRISDDSVEDPAVISDFSIRELPRNLNNSIKQQ